MGLKYGKFHVKRKAEKENGAKKTVCNCRKSIVNFFKLFFAEDIFAHKQTRHISANYNMQAGHLGKKSKKQCDNEGKGESFGLSRGK